MKMRSLELFAGLGGMAKGLELGGFEAEHLVELNHQACNSLRANFNPDLVFEGDVRAFDATPFAGIDLLAGGPPCQPFSLGGLSKAHHDERDMFPNTARILAQCCPKAFIFENVKGLVRKSFQEYFEYILLTLTYPLEQRSDGEPWQTHKARLEKIDLNNYGSVSYTVSHKLLNAADYGVPQRRERVFIVGVRNDLKVKWDFPQPTHAKNASNSLFVQPSDKLMPWVTLGEALKGIPEPDQDGTFKEDHILRSGARIYEGHTGSPLNEPAKTIKAGAHGVPGGENMIRFDDGSVRYMSTYEAKLVQTFPSDYVVTGGASAALRQIGNAVPVKLAYILGKQLNQMLQEASEETA